MVKIIDEFPLFINFLIFHLPDIIKKKLMKPVAQLRIQTAILQQGN